VHGRLAATVLHGFRSYLPDPEAVDQRAEAQKLLNLAVVVTTNSGRLVRSVVVYAEPNYDLIHLEAVDAEVDWLTADHYPVLARDPTMQENYLLLVWQF
jgi:hypothetical protein